MKKLMSFVTVLVLLASFAISAYAAVDLEKKPNKPDMTPNKCFYQCDTNGAYYWYYECCATPEGLVCELIGSGVGSCEPEMP